MNEELIRTIIGIPFVFAAFYAVPFMVEYMARKQHIKVVGWELILVLGPLVTIALLVNQDWEAGLFFLAASLGSHTGFFRISRKSHNPESNQPK